MRDILEEIGSKSPIDPEERARQLSRRELPKRFYKDVSVDEREGGHVVLLDGRVVKTPAKRLLAFPSALLASHAAQEWSKQEKTIDPAKMPLTRLANTAIDGVADRAGEVADAIAEYAGSDLLCYRAESPDGLMLQQADAWDPVIAWAGERFGGTFKLAGGLMPIEQDAALLAEVRKTFDGRTPFQLAALHTATSLTGSALLALALAEKFLDAQSVWRAAHIDEDWNIEQWGEDAEASARRSLRHNEFSIAALVLAES